MARRFVFSTTRVQPLRSLFPARFGLQAFIFSAFRSPRWSCGKSAVGEKALGPVPHPPLGTAMAQAYSTDLRVRVIEAMAGYRQEPHALGPSCLCLLAFGKTRTFVFSR